MRLGLVRSGVLGLLTLSFVAGCGSSPKEAKAPAAEREVAERGSSAPSPKASEDSIPETLVRASFQTSALALKPGGKLWLVAHFEIHEGYRISWKNPGDVGKPTRARFSVPEGFTVSEVRYPRPRRFVLNGELTSYGYQNETALFAEVEVPEGLNDQTPYRFEMDAEWYACKKQCAGESTNAFFELLADEAAPRAAMDESLQALLESVPVPVSTLDKAKHRWQQGAGETELSLSAPKVEWLDFYPARPEVPKLLRVNGSKQELRLSFQAPEDPPEMLEGVAIAKVDGAEATFEVELPWGK